MYTRRTAPTIRHSQLGPSCYRTMLHVFTGTKFHCKILCICVVVSSLSSVLPTSQMFTSGYVNTETILHFFYKIANERGTKTVFTYAHVKWFYGQSKRAYYLNYFIINNVCYHTKILPSISHVNLFSSLICWKMYRHCEENLHVHHSCVWSVGFLTWLLWKS